MSPSQNFFDSIDPVLDPETYVFASIQQDEAIPPTAVALIREAEGITVVVPNGTALSPQSIPMRRITLNIVTSLEMVGLTAHVARALSDEGIPANIVAGFHHDHIFVPAKMADRAMDILSRS